MQRRRASRLIVAAAACALALTVPQPAGATPDDVCVARRGDPACVFVVAPGVHRLEAEVIAPFAHDMTLTARLPDGTVVAQERCYGRQRVMHANLRCEWQRSHDHFRGSSSGQTAAGYRMSFGVFLPDGGTLSAVIDRGQGMVAQARTESE